jgi:hypothetical protein
LLEYLTKIETALDKAVLTSSQLVYEGANNYHFKFVFEDGSFIETPSITLVQPISKVDFLANGNSVHFVFTLMDGETIATQTIDLLKPVTAAAVRDGILYLTLSDGTEVSAGSITASFGATTFNGDVIVNGTITQKTFLLDTDIPVTFSDDAKGIISAYYAHARVSNSKLSLVIALYMPSNSVEQKTINAFTQLIQSASLTLPSSILEKLYPSPIGQLDIKSVVGQTKGYANAGGLTMTVNKDTSGLRFGLAATTDIVQGTTELESAIWRFEFNFTLS